MSIETATYTESQVRNHIDRLARRRYGVDGDAFIASVMDGTVGDQCGGSADIVALVRLLPEGQPDLVR